MRPLHHFATIVSSGITALTFALVLGAGCDSPAGNQATPADMAMTGAQPDLTPPDCTNPCNPGCVDRGPPDFSREGNGQIPAGVSDEHKAALGRANHWRTGALLAPFNANLLLEKAALNHATYLADNDRETCWMNPHSETNSKACPGFTGMEPGAREYAAGYRYTRYSEVINWETFPEEAVDRWVWSVYHRIPFFDYRLVEEGYGTISNNNVMDFGTGAVPTPKLPDPLPVFPLPGDKDVPPDFRGDLEEPTPLAPGGKGAWPQGKSSGQVISIHFGALGAKVTDHRLYNNAGGACSEVEHTVMTADNDPAGSVSTEVFLYANDMLDTGTEYVVYLGGTFQGKPFARAWAFTTAE